MSQEITKADRLTWSQARALLQSAGWLPLCQIQGAEHWVESGGNRRCILHVDAPGSAADQQPLVASYYVRFRGTSTAPLFTSDGSRIEY